MSAMRSIVVVIAVAIGVVLSPGVTADADGASLEDSAVVVPMDAETPAVQALGGDPNPNCTSHNEYDQLHSFQYPETVENIIGNDGWFIDTPHPNSFAPGERFVKVWYDVESRFSYDKAILDVEGSRVGLARVAPLDAGYPGPWDSQCWGRNVTIRGSLDGDTIVGTDHADVIFAYAGNDVILAGAGNDRVCGRWGADVINAGAGYDRVNGGMSDDLCLFAEAARKC